MVVDREVNKSIQRKPTMWDKKSSRQDQTQSSFNNAKQSVSSKATTETQEVPITYKKPERVYTDGKDEALFDELRAKKIDDEIFERKVTLNKQQTLQKRLK